MHPSLYTAIQHLTVFIHARLATYLGQEAVMQDNYPAEITAAIAGIPAFSAYGKEEQVILLLALMPHLHPGYFEGVIQQYLPQGGDFPAFGGVKGNNHRAMLPTGETAQFVLAGKDLAARIQVQELFSADHVFYQQDICWLESVKEGEPFMSGRIILSSEWLDKVLLGRETLPRFSADFPAKRLQTQMSWDDVVLHPITKEQIQDISIWLKHHQLFNKDNNLGRKVKPGYRALFYGPPGTGKTLTANQLGQQFGKEVYCIDLSQVISKYIGETEKNLEKIFNRAEHKNWILFFDEADALFGKRTSVQSSHDRYANQEVSYLLQRVESFSGLLILASNFKNNLDDAFLRRFHAIIHFPMPNAEERLMLWEKSMPASLHSNGNLDLRTLAERFELSGASILNVMHYASLRAFARNDQQLHLAEVMEGVKKELMKEEKSF